jgi:hypothetical protein
MTASVFKLTSANTTNLTKIKDGPANLKGVEFLNTGGTEFYVKFYWFKPTASAEAPTVGTTVPDLTILVAASGGGGALDKVSNRSWPDGMTRDGQLYMATTVTAADSGAAAIGAGAGILSVLYE